MPKENIAIVGSGLVGSLLAIYLEKRNHTITVFDRRPDIRNIEFSGRSINLAMSRRGWKTLEKVGLRREVEALGIPMYHRAIHIKGKPIQKQPYGLKGEAIYSISRGLLNRKMISIAEEKGVTFRFEEKVWNIDMPTSTLFTGASETGEWQPHTYDLIFGADGAFSRVRHRMQRRSRFDYSQDFLDTGYKELRIPPGPDGEHQIDKNALHIWPRGKFMLIALPNLDGSFTCTLFMPHDGPDSFENLTDTSSVQRFWEEYFPDTLEYMPTLLEDYARNPTSALVTIKCYPWTYWNKVALIGDAAHAIVPFYGQGMNAGFEDIFELDRIIDEYEESPDWQSVFERYQQQRKPNADAIAQLSYDNFIEMSSKTADPDFLLRKKIEKAYATEFPEYWLPLYSRVTFSDQSYQEAYSVGQKQQRIMDKIMSIDQIEKKWMTDEVKQIWRNLVRQNELKTFVK